MTKPHSVAVNVGKAGASISSLVLSKSPFPNVFSVLIPPSSLLSLYIFDTEKKVLKFGESVNPTNTCSIALVGETEY